MLSWQIGEICEEPGITIGKSWSKAKKALDLNTAITQINSVMGALLLGLEDQKPRRLEDLNLNNIGLVISDIDIVVGLAENTSSVSFVISSSSSSDILANALNPILVETTPMSFWMLPGFEPTTIIIRP